MLQFYFIGLLLCKVLWASSVRMCSTDKLEFAATNLLLDTQSVLCMSFICTAPYKSMTLLLITWWSLPSGIACSFRKLPGVFRKTFKKLKTLLLKNSLDRCLLTLPTTCHKLWNTDQVKRLLPANMIIHCLEPVYWFIQITYTLSFSAHHNNQLPYVLLRVIQ